MQKTNSLRTYLQHLGDSLPHVFLVFGDRDGLLHDVNKYLTEDRGYTLEQNPDIFTFDVPQFGISQVRSVSDIVSRTNVQLPQKFIIISTDAFTIEAQNALLKTIEDPDSPTIFFILISRGSYVLDTVLSRSQVLHVGEDSRYEEQVQQFLQMSYQERIEMFALFQEEGQDKKVVYKKGEVVSFLAELEKQVGTSVLGGDIDKQVYDDFIEIKQYVLDRSANMKQLLEYIALLV